MIKILFSALILSCSFIFAEDDYLDELQSQLQEEECWIDLHLVQSKVHYNEFDKNPYFSKKEKEQIKPYLLPFDHPIKPYLDLIFSSERVTLDSNSFSAAGFISKFIQPRSFIRVASHPYLPGYLVKVYLDDELRIKKETPGWKWFVNRAKNAKAIRKYIKRNKCKYFTAPEKWIYPLPINTSPPMDPAYVRKNEILVVEDMQLVSEIENLHAWKTIITKKHLNELYDIISYAGGSSYRADNIAFTISGKFAFIDTEYARKSPGYHAIVPYLSDEMAAYWKSITGIK